MTRLQMETTLAVLGDDRRSARKLTMNRHAKPSAGRSNMYSSSKYTNWSKYDPQQAELNSLDRVRPASTYRLSDGSKIPLLVMPLHSRFVRPFGCDDVKRILNIVPQEMLIGLQRIALLGGTGRQDKSAWNPSWCYGCYRHGSISLFAFPERRRIWASPDLHKPAEIHAYQRAGVQMAHENGDWVYRFTDASISRFYLWDVLVHEIGHHVDRFHPDRSTKRSERFAEWFARTYGFEAEQSVNESGGSVARSLRSSTSTTCPVTSNVLDAAGNYETRSF